MNTKRWFTLDVLKAVGILVVVVGHTFFWWNKDQGYYNIVLFNLAGIFAASLPITAGAALRFSLKKYFNIKKLKLVKEKSIIKKIVWRSFFLLALGYLMNYLTWGYGIFKWDVLQFVAVSFLLISTFLYFASLWYLVIFSSILLLFLTLIKGFLQSNYPESYLTIILVGDIYGWNYWPMLPWFFFVIYGFALAHYYYVFTQRKRHYKLPLRGLVLGISLLIISFLSGGFFMDPNPDMIWDSNIMQPPLAKVMGFAGAFTIIMSLIEIASFKIKKTEKYGFVNVFSKGILWIYLLHTIVWFRLVDALLSRGIGGVFFIILTIIFAVIFCYIVGLVVVLLKEKKNKIKHNKEL